MEQPKTFVQRIIDTLEKNQDVTDEAVIYQWRCDRPGWFNQPLEVFCSTLIKTKSPSQAFLYSYRKLEAMNVKYENGRAFNLINYVIRNSQINEETDNVEFVADYILMFYGFTENEDGMRDCALGVSIRGVIEV